MSNQEPLDEGQTHVRRDIETFTILGWFLTYLASVVLFAAFMEAPGKAKVVNFGASMVLMVIGLAMVIRSKFLRKRIR